MWKPLLIAVGLLSLVCGAIGVVLPVIPTTPFLLLSAFCFARSSERLHNYLISHRIFGEYISNYYNHAMTPRHKFRTLLTLWCGIILSCILIGTTIPWIILPLIATGVSIHIIRLKPRPEATPTASSPEADSGSEPHFADDHKA